jgi:hypothetical protein
MRNGNKPKFNNYITYEIDSHTVNVREYLLLVDFQTVSRDE